MSHHFDTLSKALATRLSRRAALHATGGTLAAGLAARVGFTAAQEATPAPVGEEPAFLFVQTAGSGSFTPNPGAGTPEVGGTPTVGGGAEYLLTLENHPGGTVYFSDRPERIVGDAPTQQFLDGLGFSPANPPNAALVTQTEDGTEDIVVVELTDPSYDESTGTLTYGATVLEEYQDDGLHHLAAQQQDAGLPESFGRASLFIDDCPNQDFWCLRTCLYAPGVLYNVGTCWNWELLQCIPCNPQLCNETYADCEGACEMETSQQVADQCTHPPEASPVGRVPGFIPG